MTSRVAYERPGPARQSRRQFSAPHTQKSILIDLEQLKKEKFDLQREIIDLLSENEFLEGQVDQTKQSRFDDELTDAHLSLQRFSDRYAGEQSERCLLTSKRLYELEAESTELDSQMQYIVPYFSSISEATLRSEVAIQKHNIAAARIDLKGIHELQDAMENEMFRITSGSNAQTVKVNRKVITELRGHLVDLQAEEERYASEEARLAMRPNPSVELDLQLKQVKQDFFHARHVAEMRSKQMEMTKARFLEETSVAEDVRRTSIANRKQYVKPFSPRFPKIGQRRRTRREVMNGIGSGSEKTDVFVTASSAENDESLAENSGEAAGELETIEKTDQSPQPGDDAGGTGFRLSDENDDIAELSPLESENDEPVNKEKNENGNGDDAPIHDIGITDMEQSETDRQKEFPSTNTESETSAIDRERPDKESLGDTEEPGKETAEGDNGDGGNVNPATDLESTEGHTAEASLGDTDVSADKEAHEGRSGTEDSFDIKDPTAPDVGETETSFGDTPAAIALHQSVSQIGDSLRKAIKGEPDQPNAESQEELPTGTSWGLDDQYNIARRTANGRGLDGQLDFDVPSLDL
jgi:hypothetical protein